MYGYTFNAIKLGFYTDFEKRGWYVICTSCNIPQDYDDYIDYEDQLFFELVSGVSKHTKLQLEEVFSICGEWFIKSLIKEWNIRFVGRSPAKFFNSWNDINEIKTYEYPNMTYDSMSVTAEDEGGFKLICRSWIPNLGPFLTGMIRYIMLNVYNVSTEEFKVIAERQQIDGFFYHSVFRLEYDNSQWYQDNRKQSEVTIPFAFNKILQYFPFYIYFDKYNEIHAVGSKLAQIIPNLVRTKINKNFWLRKPNIGSLNWNFIKSKGQMNFELCSKASEGNIYLTENEDSSNYLHLRLQGQMLIFHETGDILFLCSPRLENANCCKAVYLADLEPHDCTKSQLLATTMRVHVIRRLLDEEVERNVSQNQYSSVLVTEMKITEELINQIIPRDIADQLRTSKPFVNTCQVFKSVTVMFSDMVNFNEICATVQPIQVAELLNKMYTVFDALLDDHPKVYKVETIADAYLVVGGIPIETKHHPKHIADIAMDMVEAIQRVKVSFLNEPIKVKLGMHTGPVVAGVVGWKVSQ